MMLCALLVAGLSIGAALPPKPHPQEHQGQVTANSQANTVPIVDAVNHGRSEKDVGCQDLKDKRTSDICAQWEAADAAKEAATAAWWAVAFSFLGSALIALTFWETRKTSRAQLRAYVLLDTAQIHKCSDDGAPAFKGCAHPEARYAAVRIQNFGSTPAHNLTFRVGTGIQPFPSVQPFPEMPEGLPCSQGDLAPRATRTMTIEVFGSGPAHETLCNGNAGIFVWGLVEYDDIFGRRHDTRIQLVCEGQGYLIGRLHGTGENNESD